MSPGRWQQIERIYHDAASRTPEEAGKLLDQECAGDDVLRVEVERMLAARVKDFLETPAIAVAARALASVRSLTPGDQLGPYRIERLLGAGGMGDVYKAHDARLSRSVAIKVLPEVGGKDAERRGLLLREARTVAALNHPNIVTIHDVLSWGGQDAIVMEYAGGPTLEARIAARAIPAQEAVRIATGIVRALAAAHEAGIVHRDIKPGNIILTGDGADGVKILDFGVAKLQGDLWALDENGVASFRNVIAGTVSYMSPEQAEGKSVDARSDLFSLGSVLYEMLTGRPPFQGDSPASVCSSILRDTPQPIRPERPDVTAELDRVLWRCLEKDRETRYQSALEVLSDLIACEAMCATRQAKKHTWARRRKTLLVVLPLAALGLAAAAWSGARAYGAYWAQTVALPEISRLTNEEKNIAAYRLARKMDRYAPGDPELGRLRKDIWVPISVETEPPGADVAIRDYAADRNDWEPLGKSPVRQVRIPAGDFCVRITKPGYLDVEATADQVARLVRRTLQPADTAPDGMVLVPVETFAVPAVGRVRAGAFWLDKYEVSNAHYKEFVDAGGYRNQAYWKHPVMESGRPLPWKDAVMRFVDATGRPGPATWSFGSFPEGQQNYPVSGVNWYEAAAYAEFAGKALPTSYHWAAAADFAHFSTILRLSNFGGAGPAAAGSYAGVGRYGTYDMAGNVTEWCFNASGDRRIVRGGAWADPAYMYSSLDAASPLDRNPTRGFRCARYPNDLPRALTDALADIQGHDFGQDAPVDDRVFQVFRSMYDYDRTPLNARIEKVDDSSPSWRKERITFDAAYGNERVVAFLFLPRHVVRPYQTVLFCPGGTAMREHSSDFLELRRLGFLIRSGYAVMYPVYKGTYERFLPAPPRLPNERRDLMIQWAKDAFRSLDYLETRGELDHQKLAYFGASTGAGFGPVVTALDSRIKVLIMQGGGLEGSQNVPNEAKQINFLPHVKVPVLMMNGKYDFLSPLEHSQIPTLRFLGTPGKDQRHAVFDCGHSVPQTSVDKEMLAWLERHFGVVRFEPR